MIQEPDTRLWYVVHTKTQRELLVASLLNQDSDINIFLPEVLQTVRGRTQMAPLFPGYLFVQLDFAGSAANALLHTPGVIGFVGSEHQPTPLAESIIRTLQARVAALNTEGGLPAHSFRPGDAVVITSGPLAGLEAVFAGPLRPTQRVQVLLHFLGRQQQVKVDVKHVEAAYGRSTSRLVRPPRRTRGKGRVIHVQT